MSHNSKLKSIEERKRLATNLKAVETSNDGMVRLARILDGPARAVRKQYEDRIEAIEHTAGSSIAKARFAVYGTTEYPDATFTLAAGLRRGEGLSSMRRASRFHTPPISPACMRTPRASRLSSCLP